MAAPGNGQSCLAVTAPSWSRVKELLHQALALSPELRPQYLDEVCGADATLRAELESLLAVDKSMSAEFLKAPMSGNFGADDKRFADPNGLAVGQLFAQRFKLVELLGEGGMGQVWLAEQHEPVKRRVALKLIKAGMYDQNIVHRFQGERQSLAMMDHPAIAKVFDAGTTPQGQPYLVMEYVPGLPITEYCDQHKLRIRERVELFIQVCEGVQHAHQKAIIHRDLKPPNILVIEVDGKAVPRIIDFGLAKAAAPQLAEHTLYTRFGQLLGTPGYMSPEQVLSDKPDIDTRSDVYSLGVILYVLLTGMQPFELKGGQKPSLEEWLRQLREDDPRLPSSKLSAARETSSLSAAERGMEFKQLISLLRGDLDWIAMKALERDRERRYGSPAELAADLRRCLNDEPIMAHPASSLYQLGKFIRRHRLAAGVTLIIAILALIASASGLLAIRRQHEAEYQASQALQSQARLLTLAAAQRLKDSDVMGAQGIILEVLTNPVFAHLHAPAAISVFQDVRAADPELAVLSGHAERVNWAAYSPGGTRIASVSADKTVRIWDALTGVELAILSGHANNIYSVRYSADGARIATASSDSTVRIWDARTGQQLARLASADDFRPVRADFSPDGTRLVAASLDKTARIWDLRSGKEVGRLSGHEESVQSAAYSPDGTRIVTASRDKTARIWDAHSGAQLALLSGHGAMVLSVQYSPDGTRIVTASADKTARIWDASSGALLLVLSGHGDRIYCATYSPDGTQVVSASDDKTARIWDANSGALIGVLSGHGGFVRSAEYSPDGTRIVTASEDKTVRIWNARRETQRAVLIGHRDGVAFANVSPDSARVVTASLDKTVRIWDAATAAALKVFNGSGGFVIDAAFSPDGASLVTADADNAARIWDAQTGAQLALLKGHGDIVESVAYSADGRHILTASLDKTARIWDAQSAAQLSVFAGHSGRVLSAAYSPDGKRIVTASFDKTARVWDTSTGAQLLVLAGHDQVVSAAAYSPDGKAIVTSSFDTSARVWDSVSGAQLLMLSGHSAALQSVGYSPDGMNIVTASSDKTARIWDAHTGEQLAVLSGHGDSVQSAVYAPDGAKIVTGSLDKTARIWDARIPAPLRAQILWQASALSDPLPEAQRAELGLPPEARVRTWPVKHSVCDQSAAAFYDPDRATPGVVLRDITVDIALPACAAEINPSAHAARADFQMGRTLAAKGDVAGARLALQKAASRGYRAAAVELGELSDQASAVSLYKKAWQEGVQIAAFRLGHLYESAAEPDLAQAWIWYQQGADAGEPNALARFAAREENAALTVSEAPKRNALLLQAFVLYAAAARRAHEEAWPDDAWQHWRYRRASLARLMAAQGMMQQVAEAYATMLQSRTPRLYTMLEQIDTQFRR